MNESQRKILVIACFAFSPILLLIGLVEESALVGIILPIALVFAGFYFKKSTVTYAINRQITYEEYANAVLPRIAKAVAVGFVDAILPELQKNEDKNNITEEELKNFIVDNFHVDVIKKEFIEMMRTNYTNDEFQFLANHVLSDIGLTLFEKSQKLTKQYEQLLANETSRVAELVDVKFNLYD
jgi:hypothetical protein